MSNIVALSDWKQAKAQQVASLPPLECPKCEKEQPASSVSADGAVLYRCAGPGHRPFSWRITEDGGMLQGPTGSRPYYAVR